MLKIIYREIILSLFTTSKHRKAILLSDSSLNHLILPVNIITLSVILLFPYPIDKTTTIICTSFTNHFCQLVQIYNIKFVRECTNTKVNIKVYRCLTCLTVLCSNHDNTVSTLRTIDSGSRSILEDLKSLNITRVKEVGISTYLNTVNNIERKWRTVYRSDTTNTNLRVSLRSTVLL